jgi:hypothetical protein
MCYTPVHTHHISGCVCLVCRLGRGLELEIEGGGFPLMAGDVIDCEIGRGTQIYAREEVGYL